MLNLKSTPQAHPYLLSRNQHFTNLELFSSALLLQNIQTLNPSKYLTTLSKHAQNI